MPNWAFSQYHAVGDKEQLKQLYDTMHELESMKDPGLCDNGFGSSWLGNLVVKLGGNYEKIYCRGSWDNLSFNDCYLYFQCEESGNCIYETNDATGDYFPERFCFWVEDEDTEYYETLEDLTEAVEGITGSKHLRTLDSCKKAMETYSRRHHDCCYTLEEFKVVE